MTDHKTRPGDGPIIITGIAGFIGFHVAQRLLSNAKRVVGIDSFTPYYDPALKRARIDQLQGHGRLDVHEVDIADQAAMADLFKAHRPSVVIHLAAQAGVRYSLEEPASYIHSNIDGMLSVLEGCRHNDVGHLIFASSSSVYGANTALPFSEHDCASHPVSLYGATKRANELMAHSYSDLFGIPCTGLRFFTVYGPWGRPDMALFRFIERILSNRPIEIYNRGEMQRDFTYVDDVADAVVRLIDAVPGPNPDWDGSKPTPATSRAPFRLFNIGNNRPEQLLHLIDVLERCLGVKAERALLPMQAGDVRATYADVSALDTAIGFAPNTPIEVGVRRFVDWYRSYYGV